MPTQSDWNAFYADNNTPWDLGGPSPVLRAVLDLGLLRGRDRVVVPGCGRGHDVLQLSARGHLGVGVDFAPDAIALLDAAAAERGLTVESRVADIFSLLSEPAGSFDGAFEYTCFCAIDPSDRPRYRDLLTYLVRPGGRLVYPVFPTWRDVEGGPPWKVELAEVKALFAERWSVVLESEPLVTPEPRQTRETLLVLERK